ncbi:hypothetical protein FRB94_008674 [Tulasnella sp. JGI-2019a]|nr:hypothetical protein FRB94_008674 [Tulasnella sp. JGI-2019a]
MFARPSSSRPQHSRSMSAKFSHIPPSIHYGSLDQPTISVRMPAWEVNPTLPSITIDGEIDLDVSCFARNRLQYSIGLSLFDERGTRVDWNQDGPENYHRTRSAISLADRVVVDGQCFMNFAVRIPSDAFPTHGQSRVMSVGIKAYALDKPDLTTEMVTVQFMMMNVGYPGRRRGSSVRY